MWNKTETRRLYCVEWHNTVFTRSGPLSVHKLLTSCFGRCLVSRSCDWVISALSAASLIFSFQFSLLFFHVSVARQHQNCGVLSVLIRNVGHWTFTVRGIQPKRKNELILTVKMETIHPVEGQFCSEFPAICSHRGVTTAWSRETWKFCEHFCVCKRPLTVKCLKFWSQSFYRFTDRRCCVQMS